MAITEAGTELRNWAGNQTFSARRVHRPTTVEQVQDLVAGSPRIRALGSRHSFNRIADGEVLLETVALNRPVEIDSSSRTARVCAGERYGAVAAELERAGWALGNLASLPHITVGGAIATATHGSGDRNPTLSAAVSAVQMVTADGELRSVRRGADDFDGMVVGLGALGVITEVTLDLVPSFRMRQDMYRGLSWDRLLSEFDDITAAGHSVSINPDWNGDDGAIRVKTVVHDDSAPVALTIAGAERTTTGLPDVPGATDRTGRVGLWHDRLPHFGIDHAPSFGDEVQSEWLLARTDAVAALDALRSRGPRLTPDLIWSSEVRTMSLDPLWLSGAHGRDTVGIHITWKQRPEAVNAAIVAIEAILAPFTPRPHWGKLSALPAADVRSAYPRFPDFIRLRDQLDPERTFTNAWLEQLLEP
ncbi:FAD-binding protein [Curtobacterium sp. MCSS17_008]|uniref:FAD-binding protein n=1 Tax=Curtobacterium sp. MCSS17_008 TaxID=2175647 RepID=UPI000DA88147|nr:FAD-binding protein [Curtobacterium sp. MCSS17_008]PZF53308.1 FAD-binding protein [Curtobacterium sp. MCSS17_008]